MGEISDGEALFPGESEIAQLYVIQKVMGELTPEQKEMFAKNPRFVGLRFPDISKPETLEKHYVGKINKKGIDLMNGLLEMDPHKRLTALEALAHPYFDGIRDEEVNNLIAQKRERTSNGDGRRSTSTSNRADASSHGPRKKSSMERTSKQKMMSSETATSQKKSSQKLVREKNNGSSSIKSLTSNKAPGGRKGQKQARVEQPMSYK